MATPPLPDHLLQEAVDCLARHGGNQVHTARELKIHRATLQGRIENAKRRGISSTIEKLETLHGWNPDADLTKPIPSPLVIRGTSTLYGDDGALKLQWVKTKLSQDQADAAIRAAISALSETMPRAVPVERPNHCSDQLLNLYTFTDCHVGMKAWAKETGDDWDLDITERMLKSAFDYLVHASPPAFTCIINQLGDFLHFDSLSAITPLHGNLLDADSRFSKVVKVAIRILRYIIDQALLRHDKVIVIMAEGNHDPASSVWLRHLFSLLYENEPRVQVIDCETPYIAYQHGINMLAFHHGHLTKPDQLPILFAATYPEMWGATTKRYAHSGHQHHMYEKEHSGMTVTQHRTIAARDAYAARGGWIADREIQAITYNALSGKAGTIICTPEMLN